MNRLLSILFVIGNLVYTTLAHSDGSWCSGYSHRVSTYCRIDYFKENCQHMCSSVDPGLIENGGWGSWSTWGACSELCGNGESTKNRACDSPAPHSGTSCPGGSQETKACNNVACAVDGAWSLWGTWGDCSVACSTGSHSRTRTCTNPPPQENNGTPCPGSATDTEDCNTSPCPIDGGLSVWGSWDTCTTICGELGSQTRTRTCTSPIPMFSGNDCMDPLSATQSCNVLICPVDGGYTSWTSWSTCTETCGRGYRSKSRCCTEPTPAHSGSDCTGIGLPIKVEVCYDATCQVDGEWGSWSLYGGCSKSCASGNKYHDHDCVQPSPHFGGSNCTGSATSSATCNTDACPIHGDWALWSPWSTCTDYCKKFQQRCCSDPLPEHGGNNCTGDSLQDADCNAGDDACPVSVPTTTAAPAG